MRTTSYANIHSRSGWNEVARRRRRAGVDAALRRSYSLVFKNDHPCHNGPTQDCVARELHHNSILVASLTAHLHLALKFPAEHRWERIESDLREKERLKVDFDVVGGKVRSVVG